MMMIDDDDDGDKICTHAHTGARKVMVEMKLKQKKIYHFFILSNFILR